MRELAYVRVLPAHSWLILVLPVGLRNTKPNQVRAREFRAIFMRFKGFLSVILGISRVTHGFIEGGRGVSALARAISYIHPLDYLEMP